MKTTVKLLFLLPLVFLFFIPILAQADESQDCIFTSYIEKSWVFFQERPWVTGFVNNCDPEQEWKYYTSNEESYYKKDRVFVRILDINGVLVEDGAHIKNKMARNNDMELSAYKLSYTVNRSDEIHNTMGKNIVTVHNNQYFFYLPQIHQFDFEHREIYQIELKYGDHINTIWFAVLDPDKRWNEN